MKKIVLSMIIGATLLACEDDTSDIVINIDNGGGGETGELIKISGHYTENLTLEADKDYLLNGPLVMGEGTVLTIAPGTVVKALATGAEIYVAITQGAKINAQGTVDKPIVFTSLATTPEAGDWGGIIILGKAPINGGNPSSTSEIGSLPYGGTDTNDNSGTLQYVRVEYSGGKVDGQSENNAFSFYGVGNATQVAYIQAYEGLDDGVEFFGGTVGVSYVSVINLQDDSVDWTEGYNGTIDQVYIEQRNGGATPCDKALEGDGYNTDSSNISDPVYYSEPQISNVTIYGAGGSTVHKKALNLRAGTAGVLENFTIEGYDLGIDLDGEAGALATTQGDFSNGASQNPTGQQVLQNNLSLKGVVFTAVSTKMKNDTGETFTESDFITDEGKATGTDYASWSSSWTKN